MIVKFTAYRYGKDKTAYRKILYDGKLIGSIKRVPATFPNMAHWSGEIVNDRGETWRINEPSLDMVISRIDEAFTDER